MILIHHFVSSIKTEPPENSREETIQVNAISTTLLALLLLPWLKQQHRERKGVSPTPHLVFVGSGSHLEVDIKSWPSYVAQDGGVIAHYSKKDNHSSSAIDTTMYATSKLILQYAIEEVSKLALGSNGQYVFLQAFPSFLLLSPPPPPPSFVAL